MKVTYDASRISYGRLLEGVFRRRAQSDRAQSSGAGRGHAGSARRFSSRTTKQKRIAEAYIRQLNDAHVFNAPIVTTVVPLDGFYAAEAHHQNFIARNPSYPYVVHNDLPKLEHLRKAYPELLKRR